MRGAVAPEAFELQHNLAFAIAAEPFVGDRRAADVAAQPFESRPLMRSGAHCGMEAEAVRIGAKAGSAGFPVAAHHGAQTQHLLSGTRIEGDSIGARGGLQGLERVIGSDVGEVGHPLLFNEIAPAGEQSHEPHDNLLEQALQLIAVGGACFVKERFIPGAAIDAVEHQAMKVDIQIGRRAEAPDERDAACVGGTSFKTRLLAKKARDHALHDA